MNWSAVRGNASIRYFTTGEDPASSRSSTARSRFAIGKHLRISSNLSRSPRDNSCAGQGKFGGGEKPHHALAVGRVAVFATAAPGSERGIAIWLLVQTMVLCNRRSLEPITRFTGPDSNRRCNTYSRERRSAPELTKICGSLKPCLLARKGAAQHGTASGGILTSRSRGGLIDEQRRRGGKV